MAINYTLNIGSVTKRLTEGEFSNVVVEASFNVSANSDSVTTTNLGGNETITIPAFSYSCGGTKTFPVGSLDVENFIEFENVTKDTIVQWLLAEEGVTSIEDFSYVKNSIKNIAQRIYEHTLEVLESVVGQNPAGTSDYVYTPPAPAPVSEGVIDTPAEPIT